MQSVFNFIVKPKLERTTSIKQIKGKELILNTDLQNHEFTSRHGIVINKPLIESVDINKGDEIIVHHNVFRRFYDIRGNEKNSKSYFEDNKFFVQHDQIFLYKRNNEWKSLDGYCFVKPLINKDKFDLNKEQPLKGIVVYTNDKLEKMGIKKNTLIGFTPNSEYEFIIENQKLYRIKGNSITIKYERQGNEEEYNPSWL